MITRHLNLEKEIQNGKTLVIYGPRRVGKTTLLQNFMNSHAGDVAYFNGDEIRTQEMLSTNDAAFLKQIVGRAKILCIDEAQEIPSIGKSLKIVNDTMPGVAVVATGSSSFSLAGQVGEPLTGRMTTRLLYPIAASEQFVSSVNPYVEFSMDLETMLIYGMYPDIRTTSDNKVRAGKLNELVNSYLLRDILTFQSVKGSNVILQLLVLLAHQVGSEVSHTELGQRLGLDKATVERYLDLLEKSFVIFRLSGFSRNLRNELRKKAKYYFFDTGIRNAVINNFNDFKYRNDVGALWENFVIIERMKHREYARIFANQYFWRTYEQKEIDFIEEYDGMLYAYEMKWSISLGEGKRKLASRAPALWTKTYGEQSIFSTMTPQNVLDFIGVSSSDK